MRLTFPYLGKTELLKDYQNTDDIVRSLLRFHGEDSAAYDSVAKHFWRGNVRDTAKYIFDFLKRNLRYDVEANDDQTIMSPGAMLRQGHGDCKHYASFVCGIVDALKRQGYPINCAYRFASYYDDKKEPHHVFAVVIDPKTGREYWTDPVFNIFDYKKKYVYAYDKYPTGMALSRISGIGKKATKRPPRKERRAGKKTERKARRKERKSNRPKGGFLKKVGGAPSRNAYLLLLKMNLFRTASKIMAKVKDDPEKQRALKEWWGKMGGNWMSYKKAIEQGVRVWNKHHKDKQIQGKLSGATNKYGWDSVFKGIYMPGIGSIPFEAEYIGVVPVVAGAAAVIAAAAPIIKMAANMLKKLGVQPDEQAEDEAIREGDRVLEDAATASNDQDYYGDDVNEPVPEENSDFLDENSVSSDDEYVPGDEDYMGVVGLFRSKAAQQRVKLRKQAAKTAKGTKANPVRMPAVKVSAKRPTGANVKIPIARKTKTVNRAPFIQVTTQKLPNVPTQKRQQLTIPRVEATPQPQRTDNGGVSDFFTTAKNFLSENKMPLIFVGGGFVLYKVLINSPTTKRRR